MENPELRGKRQDPRHVGRGAGLGCGNDAAGGRTIDRIFRKRQRLWATGCEQQGRPE
jgi:hypothetical protein